MGGVNNPTPKKIARNKEKTCLEFQKVYFFLCMFSIPNPPTNLEVLKLE